MVSFGVSDLTGTRNEDPGDDYYTRLRPDRTRQRAIHHLEAMGCHVTLEEPRKPPKTHPGSQSTVSLRVRVDALLGRPGRGVTVYLQVWFDSRR